ncbi:MAG: O-methyltransferase [Bacteroidota bacterium]
MYSPVLMVFKYLRYYITASNGKGHGIHSPFVFDFVQHVLNDDRQFYAYRQIENLRQLLLNDQRILEVEDFGAGSKIHTSPYRKIATIANTSLEPAKFGQLLFRMVNRYSPSDILELGTSFGITTCYLAMADSNASVTTMEGSSAIANIARGNFQKLGIRNCRLMEGNFDDTLPQWLKEGRKIDMAFIDGNHRYEPTVKYFKQLLNYTNENSILIFDDIHWSKEMEKAWKEIQEDDAVTLSIDLFFIGIIFFRKEFSTKQHVSIRF